MCFQSWEGQLWTTRRDEYDADLMAFCIWTSPLKYHYNVNLSWRFSVEFYEKMGWSTTMLTPLQKPADETKISEWSSLPHPSQPPPAAKRRSERYCWVRNDLSKNVQISRFFLLQLTPSWGWAWLVWLFYGLRICHSEQIYYLLSRY